MHLLIFWCVCSILLLLHDCQSAESVSSNFRERCFNEKCSETTLNGRKLLQLRKILSTVVAQSTSCPVALISDEFYMPLLDSIHFLEVMLN